jgi:CheY-like chemotaxis protein
MPSNVRVLLVDDNPVILDMLRKALDPLAQLTSLRSGRDALAQSIANPPDLVIVDYQMPDFDGRELVQQLRAHPTLSHVPIILMASKADQNERLGMLRDSVEDFVEKPFFMRDAVSRIKRVIDKVALEKMAREASTDGAVRGSLAQMNAIDLLQSLELGRKSCKLTLNNGSDSCAMYFADGNLTHAIYGDLVGDEAVYKVLLWPEGTWELDFNGATDQQTTTRSTQGLLMEGLRLLDEANRDASEDNILDA